jgi:hypothetical protein
MEAAQYLSLYQEGRANTRRTHIALGLAVEIAKSKER